MACAPSREVFRPECHVPPAGARRRRGDGFSARRRSATLAADRARLNLEPVEERMARKTLRAETTAEAYLELLPDRGVEYFLGNAGTAFAPLVEAFARSQEERRPAPTPLVIPHEFVAVSMGHGYYLGSGRPLAVMVHVTVGTGNASTAIISASRANVPLLMSAGCTPITEEGLPGARDLHIHWAQESFDQAAMLPE